MSRWLILVLAVWAGIMFISPVQAADPATDQANPLSFKGHWAVPDYDPPAKYDKMIIEKDLMVPMRDGVKLSVDICRPDAPGKFPALLSMAVHNKDLQGPDLASTLPPQPAWSHLWWGGTEVGDTQYFVSRGYVHVLGQPRNIGKSDDGPPNPDYYDLIEWIAQQPWCDGNVGMSGLSAFGAAQFLAAQQQPPHLKAIMPQDPGAAYSFRDANPGGVIHVFGMLLAPDGVAHITQTKPGTLPEPLETYWKEAMANPDFRIHTRLYNILNQKGQLIPRMFYTMLDPYDSEQAIKATEDKFKKINIPYYTGSGWYAHTYKTHFQGFQSWWANVDAPKKLMVGGPDHYERPFHENCKEILRWYDYWLKGVDTGIMKEPPVKLWVMGANRWMYANDWPLPETQWTRLYLDSWERLRPQPFIASSREGYEQPDAFVQMPPTQTNTIERLRYMTDPLPKDTLIAGPITLTLHAALDQDDTNWIVILKDVGPDVSVQTARQGEWEIPSNLPERELTRGWLKASLRELDSDRSKPWKPWHKLTRESRKPVVPGEINEYQIEVAATANLFEKGHRICLEITSLDLPTGVAGATNVEYIPYHICSSKTVLHKIYHNEKYPSNLLLPVIPETAQQWIEKQGISSMINASSLLPSTILSMGEGGVGGGFQLEFIAMKKRTACLWLVFLLSSTMAWSAEKVIYVNGFDPYFPPFSYLDAKGRPAGFDIEALDRIAAEMGFQVRHQPVEWNRMIESLRGGKIDLIASGLTADKELDNQIRFTIPYWTIDHVLLTRTVDYLDIDDIFINRKIKDLSGPEKTAWLRNHGFRDGWQYELRLIEPASVPKQTPGGMATGFFAYGVREEDSHLLTMLNAGLSKVMASSQWKELIEKYLSVYRP